MLFSSYIYIFLFLPVVVTGYFVLNRRRLILAGRAWLILASLFFYAWGNPAYLPLLAGSILFNYSLGTALQKARQAGGALSPRLLLLLGITANLGLLGYYKYADFFLATFAGLTGADFNLLHLILPLAISFFTFQQIAYLLDCSNLPAGKYDFLNYCLFVSFFPQLIAGPIVRHRETMPQFTRLRNALPDWRNIAHGITIFFIGLFKKVIIADTFAVWADAGFGHLPVLNFTQAWTVSLSYTLQLYYDFSGYTDMAIGSALLFNIRLPINFYSPYKALDIRDFWRRWHMTLSRWLKDYVYIPLGGSRQGIARTCVNLFVTFLLCGLWHGAGWTFVLWGAMHGAAVVIHRVWQKLGLRLPALPAWLLTFLFLNCSWVLFRAATFADAAKVFKGMFGMNGLVLPETLRLPFGVLAPFGVRFEDDILAALNGDKLNMVVLVLFGLGAVLSRNSLQMAEKMKPDARWALLIVFIAIYGLLGVSRISEFIYFQF
jgi:D-alanyl-lipoteichoic acid acyltransferase DltB (MBOAT superfamily)